MCFYNKLTYLLTIIQNKQYAQCFTYNKNYDQLINGQKREQ